MNSSTAMRYRRAHLTWRYRKATNLHSLGLLDENADVNAPDKLGFTPLMKAAFNGNLPLVKRLLARGAKVDIGLDRGITALLIAVTCGRHFRGRVRIVRLLLAKGTEVNVRAERGRTPLTNAAEVGNLAIVRALLVYGADVNTQIYKYGMTPLMLTGDLGNTEIARILLAWGADVHIKDRAGATAMEWIGDKTIRKLMRQAGAKSGLSSRFVL